MRVLILGMNNPDRDDCLPPDDGGSGQRLFEMSGLDLKTWLTRFERRNVLEARRWSIRDARRAGRQLRQQLRAGRQVVLLGNGVADALGLSLRGRGTVVVRGVEFHLVPHPSGRNLIYNRPGEKTKTRNLFSRFV